MTGDAGLLGIKFGPVEGLDCTHGAKPGGQAKGYGKGLDCSHDE
jgi:hypothetical protein